MHYETTIHIHHFHFFNLCYLSRIDSNKRIFFHDNKWEIQDEPQAVLKRVTFYKDKGIGFVFGSGEVTTYYDYKEWDQRGNIYTIENSGGIIFSVQFNSNKTKVENVYISMNIKINDERLGEVTRKTEFKFDVD